MRNAGWVGAERETAATFGAAGSWVGGGGAGTIPADMEGGREGKNSAHRATSGAVDVSLPIGAASSGVLPHGSPTMAEAGSAPVSPTHVDARSGAASAGPGIAR